METPIRVDEIDGMWKYLTSIDWSDPWLRYLILFHVLCFMISVLIRKRNSIQFIFFGLLLMLVFFSENINEWAAKNYRLFSRQQYFDDKGLFISTVFSTPILINCLIMVIMWLLTMSQIMSDVRLAKRKYQKKNADNTKTEKLDPNTEGDREKAKME